MITTIVSDFGGVLTTPLYDAFLAYEKESGLSLEELGNALGAITLATGKNPMVELEIGAITEREFLDAQAAQVSKQLGRTVSMDNFTEIWFSHLHPNHEMFAEMRSLKERGLAMVLLTNNVQEWEPRWRPKLPIDEIFELVVDSGFVGMRKPDPEIYALTAERAGVPGAEILFVDDVEANITAARDAGWHAVHFHDNAQAIPEIEAALSA